ncbi:MAG: glycoside hydrolase family 3 C-terminal domain-containing protein [Acidimicrobiales bacterium]
MTFRGGRRLTATFVAFIVALGLCVTIGSSRSPAGAANDSLGVIPVHSASCPWVKESRRHERTPLQLAQQVVAKMTLNEKARFVTLDDGHDIENFNQGIPSLCIPQLTLSDGPDGLAGLTPHVTQLPAAIGLGASFDTSLTYATGQVAGQEARAKGIDVVQGPDLNLARVPLSGRIFESYGEDPDLTSALGVANIEGIQSTGVMALAKHFTAYSQETARARIDDDVTTRALAELYNAPFEAAVKDAHVAGIMCASGKLNGVDTCSNPYIYDTLRSWGFEGFVRSDNRAATYPAVAFAAGLDMVKPGTPAYVEKLVRLGRLPMKDLNRAVTAILKEMFAYGLIAHPRVTNGYASAATPEHTAVALRAARESIVLLKNTNNELPLSSSHGSVAVIGVDASLDPLTSGLGSSAVIAPFVATPLAAIRHTISSSATVSYSPGSPVNVALGRLGDSGTVTLKPLPLLNGSILTSEIANDDLSIEAAADVTNAINTASAPGSGRGWSHWSAVFRPKKTGEYEVALDQIGDTWFSVNGRTILSSSGLHEPTVITDVLKLKKHHRYTFKGTWFTVSKQSPPELGLSDVTYDIRSAVAAARTANVAVVFAGSSSTEGADHATLSLPGDQNQLIEAVAAANPHTVVVLNTEGPVLMPWLKNVQSVLEAWYPGEEDGTAIASALFGSFDPSGRLPVTFPASESAQPTAAAASFPGIDDTTYFGTGSAALDVGYRWYQAHDVTPLFPFGYGLSYTTFSLERPSLRENSSQVTLTLDVTNTGKRSGIDVVEGYVKDPPAANEPPEQLKAFSRVALAPGQTRPVRLTIPLSSLSIYLHGQSTLMPGEYGFRVGSSSADLPISLPFHVSTVSSTTDAESQHL